ncbi:MAG: MtnX-like HAD-IB family phosphatase [Nitrospiraceae bacterium]|nr:MtnX-like HAD-IB family phosphatase [Nitrospiraceae bacterium]
MEQKKPSSVIQKRLKGEFFVSIDFDGTVTDADITDALIKEFAGPGWEEAERLWEAGIIGSRECLFRQMSLIDAPMERIMEHLKNFSANKTFADFVRLLRRLGVPFCIISDGFKVIIDRLLSDAGLCGVPVCANELIADENGLKAVFPHAVGHCTSGLCKCGIASEKSNGLPVIHIGDGRSDFCLAEKAAYVFSKGRLTDFCNSRGICHTPFDDFTVIGQNLMALRMMKEPLIAAGTKDPQKAYSDLRLEI